LDSIFIFTAPWVVEIHCSEKIPTVGGEIVCPTISIEVIVLATTHNQLAIVIESCHVKTGKRQIAQLKV
jgi:hypothetical protein